MAIGSVEELVDYKEQTVAIAKKYGGSNVVANPEGSATAELTKLGVGETIYSIPQGGGGTVDLGLIADNYNPDRTTAYPVNDMVVNNGKLYRATSETPVSAGNFDSTMWDEIPTYDPTQTYNYYDVVVYDGVPYSCNESSVTGEWDASKWTDASATFPTYDSSASYHPYGGSRCSYESKFYKTNATYQNNGGVGEFNPSKWTETTVEEVINNQKVKVAQICSNSDLATDANGFVTNALTLPQDLGTIVSVQTAGNMLALGKTFLIQYFYGVVNGSQTFKIRLLNTDGTPLANKSAGTFSDAGVITVGYF